MHASSITLGKRLLAVLAALLTFSLALIGMATPANAADGNINFADGTINVYKHANPGGNLTSGNGTEATAGGAALNGVEFTLYKVDGVDLTTVEGWDVVNTISEQVTQPVTPELDNNDSPQQVTVNGIAYNLELVEQKATAGAGLAAFSDLSPALYVVVEGNDTGNNNITAKAAPFFVALPISANNEWQKTVNVYPKNVVAEGPKKSVATDTRNDGLAATDGTHTWTVTQLIPTFDATSKPTALKLVDDLSGVVTTGTGGSTTATADSVALTLDNGATLTKGTDYTVALNGTNLEITLQQTGLDKLTSGATLTATYTTTGEVGTFTNSVETFINGTDPEDSVGEASATSYLGKIVVNKTDAENGKALDGAEFKVCAVAQDGTNAGSDCDPVDNMVADGNGTYSLDKLALGTYVIVETVQPAGYVLDQTPRTVTISDTSTTVNQDIENSKQALPGLPLTGAQGKLLLTLTGAGLLLVAFGFIIVGRRRKEEEEAQA